MATTVYVLDPDAEERKRIGAALAPDVAVLVFLDDISALPAHTAEGECGCLLLSAEAAEPGAVEIVRELRRQGNAIAVIALGSHSAFRSAIDIARMEATDFLERPVSVRDLRRAVRRVCKALP
jgi:FixJ family two-component response regulator